MKRDVVPASARGQGDRARPQRAAGALDGSRGGPARRGITASDANAEPLQADEQRLGVVACGQVLEGRCSAAEGRTDQRSIGHALRSRNRDHCVDRVLPRRDAVAGHQASRCTAGR